MTEKNISSQGKKTNLYKPGFCSVAKGGIGSSPHKYFKASIQQENKPYKRERGFNAFEISRIFFVCIFTDYKLY